MSIQFNFELDGAAMMIQADEQQLEQALINIIKNALEAIGSGGTVTIRTDAARSTLCIIDTGKGISEMDADHLFSPFFSTKRDGQGIGLMLIKEILRSHDFHFSLRTTGPGRTEFAIRF